MESEGATDRGEASPADPGRFGSLPPLLLLAWCGLLAGHFESLAFTVRKRWFDVNQFLWTTRHYPWLLPLVNLALFLLVGSLLAILLRAARERGRWWAARILCTATLLPGCWAVSSRIYAIAGLLFSTGCAVRLTPELARHPQAVRRAVLGTFPLLVALTLALAAIPWRDDRRALSTETAAPLPPTGTPNVLLIVLDTVAAEHLSLHGYSRRTSPTLEELAARGIRFDRAVSTASWTLPSHASLFTGRWPHELSSGWNTPLDGTHATLAEILTRRGFATAGFVGNRWYCSRDSGLARGFARYADDSFPRLTPFGKAELVARPLLGLQTASRFLEDWLAIEVQRPIVDWLTRQLQLNRRGTEDIRREFVAWLEARPQPERPFFAFVNLYDAHYPYELAEPSIHRFRSRARAERDANLLRDWVSIVGKSPTAEQVELGRDFYDDCIADQDERLGRLLDQLAERKALDRTWIIVTADHGESFGEQPGVFWHGTSLFQAQIHVPLLIVPPGGLEEPRVVADAVSLRDLPSTILDVLGPGGKSEDSLPGTSLAHLWTRPRGESPTATRRDVGPALSELIPLDAFGANPSEWVHAPAWPTSSLTQTGLSYIRRGKDGAELLFDLAVDPGQQKDLAADPASRPRLDAIRREIDRLTDGPLTPDRFRP
ncbi:sulfatase [Aquisphaera insulae]|uniref:sulfatase n=1 Tax=Aquisphaera insulae TaxID=2712864 RepID=UPI0013EBE50F|nr:sulfatase [Aquisphaera insulae]